MSREIITRKSLRQEVQSFDETSDPPVKNPDPWQDQLLKLLPAEIIGAYITVTGLILTYNDKIIAPDLAKDSMANIPKGLFWSVFSIFFILNPLYLRYVTHVTNVKQIWLATFAFVVWAISLGGPIDFFGMPPRLIGSILIPIYTLVSVIVMNADNNK